MVWISRLCWNLTKSPLKFVREQAYLKLISLSKDKKNVIPFRLLTDNFKEQDENTQLWVITILAAIGEPETIEEIQECIHKRTIIVPYEKQHIDGVIETGMMTIAKSGDEKTLEYLGLFLGGFTTAPAAYALGKYYERTNDKNAIDLLIDALSKVPDHVGKSSIIEVLGKIGDKQAIDPIINTLYDKKLFNLIHEKVLMALLNIGDFSAIDYIEEFIENGEYDNYTLPKMKEFVRKLKKFDGYDKYMMEKAKNFEKAGRNEKAAKIYEELELWDEAGRVRKKI